MDPHKKHGALIYVIDAVLALILIVGIIFFFEIRVVKSHSGVMGTIEPLSLIYASTPDEQQLGLGGRTSLPADEGMLFIFQTPGNYGFWMKDMLFPIDIIWLDDHFAITHIAANVAPDTYPESFYPGEGSRYVLETNAGYSQKNNLSVGETLDFVKKSLLNTQ